jgi:hypothetical protein
MLSVMSILLFWSVSKFKSHPKFNFYLGLLLIVAILVLLSYNWRKKLTFIPLGKSSSWLQFHLYIGIFSFFAFLIHVNYSVPSGLFELSLFGLYLTVFVSGVLGLILSRSFPKRITAHGTELMYERLPTYLFELRKEAEELVEYSLEDTKSAKILELYYKDLDPFFANFTNQMSHLFEATRPINQLMRLLGSHERYLNDKEKQYLVELKAMCLEKNHVDYNYALQSLLKRWFYVHIPFSYLLFLFGVVHGLLVYAFQGGL